MRTIEYLSDPVLRATFLPGVVAAMVIALMSGPLSVLVTLKRYAFIGQGVSHAAFGGVGLALLLGLEMGQSAPGVEKLASDLVILGFALAAAGAISALRRRTDVHVDTAIGIVLAGCMAAGFVMHGIAASMRAQAGLTPAPSLESILFGSILRVGWPDVAIASVSAGLILGVGVWKRRRIVLWAFDEQVSPVHGVRPWTMELLALAMVSLATIVIMKTAGVVLATAMLVLPGATALRFARSLTGVIATSTMLSVLGVAAGVVVSFEASIQTGPAVVGVLLVLYAAASLWSPSVRAKG